MKTSELIKELKKHMKKHGDLPVKYDNYGDREVWLIETYNSRGGKPDKIDPEPVEIYIH